MSTLSLEYINDDDKAYGLAGMTISIAALHPPDRLVSVSLDSEGPMMTFSHEYYFCGSPSLSPKAVWTNLVNNYNLTAAMALSNVMARSMIRLGSEVPADIMKALHERIVEEGRDTCGLEDYEIESLYNRANSYMRRIFNNRRLHPAVDELVRTLSVRRTMSAPELADTLHLLQII